MTWMLVIIVSGNLAIHSMAMNTVTGFKSRADCDRAASFTEMAIRKDRVVKAYCIITDLEPK